MTIREVAKHAGVSLQTVSNVINGKLSQVGQETRERVLRSIEELGYQPNTHARGLRSQRTYTIAYLTVDPAARFMADPFHNAILSGMADTVREEDYCLLVHALAPEKPEETFMRLFQQRRFDGAAVHLSGPEPIRRQCLDRLHASACPFVLMEERGKGPHCACVLADNRSGAERAVDHLVARGHKHLAFLRAAAVWPAVEERQAGFEAATQAHRLPAPRTITIENEEIELARKELEEQLRRSGGIDAVLCGNDVLAVGALQAAKSVGRKIPDELAIVGFDDFDFTRYVEPPLSTVALPAYDLGRRAAELLLDHFRHGKFAEDEVVFPTTLVTRGTS